MIDRRKALGLAASVVGAALLSRGGRASMGKSSVTTGKIEIPEISGGTLTRNGALLLVADEGNGVFLFRDAAKRLQSGSVKPKEDERLRLLMEKQVDLEDLEDAAWDERGSAFLITSHARSKRGDSPEQRYRLARLRFDATGLLLKAEETDALFQAIVNELPFLADAVRRPPARSGLNIEGLAWSPEGHLLIGLRAPTITESVEREHGGQEDAVVLRLTNPHALFEEQGARALLADTVKLDLRGQGIRGMCLDPSREFCWLISGLSADPTHDVQAPWGLWRWDMKGAAVPASVPKEVDLETPETVAALEVDGKPHLLLIDDEKDACRYALFPVPEA
ncbi:MAG: DUF3616 domain-containing protein [Armatimonadota bacterium]